MKHFCPMCGEQWNEDACESCGWYEGKDIRDASTSRRNPARAKVDGHDMEGKP